MRRSPAASTGVVSAMSHPPERAFRRRVQQSFQLLVQPAQRDRHAGHLHRGRVTADQRHDDGGAGIMQTRRHDAIQDVQLLGRCRSKAVDQDPTRDRLGSASCRRADGPTSRSATASAGRSLPRHTPGSPWMPMPISISSSAMEKVGRPAPAPCTMSALRRSCGNRIGAFCAIRVTSSRSAPASAAAPASLVGIHHAGHTAPLLRFRRRRAGDIVGQQHGGGPHVLHLQHIAGHVEVHPVAAIVAV